MRPPEFTGGNATPQETRLRCRRLLRGFNEAAGIHRRKHLLQTLTPKCKSSASMKPPEFTGGN